MKLTKNNNLGLLIIYAILYYIVLNVVYVCFQEKVFSYVGYACDINYTKLVVGIFLYLFTVMILLPLGDFSSSTAIYLLFYIGIAPFIVLYQYEDIPVWMVLYQVILLLLLSGIITFLRRTTIFSKLSVSRIEASISKIKNYTEDSINETIVKYVYILVIFFFIYMLMKYKFPRFELLSFSSISQIRSEASFSLAINLMMNVTCRILIPLLVSLYIDLKKYVQLLVLAVIQLYLYSITGFKTYLFVLVMVILLKFIKTISMKKAIVIGLAGAILAATVFYMVTGNNMSIALINDRVIFFPAQIKWAYMDYFSNHPFVLFSQNSIAKLLGVSPVYDMNVPNLIGGTYFNSFEMWTNTGYMVDAFANLGILGGAVMTFFLGLELHFVDKVTNYKDKGAVAGIFLIFYISLNEGGLIYVSVSGGFLLAIVVYSLISSNKSRVKRLQQ